MFGEEPQREQDQIIEIDRIAGAQSGFVAGADVLGQARTLSSPNTAARSPRFEAAQQAENCRRVRFLAFGRDLRQDLLTAPVVPTRRR